MPPSNTTEASILSLEQLWDGVFPPRPPRPEDLIFTEEREASLAPTKGDSSVKEDTDQEVLPQDETESAVAPTLDQ